MTKTVDTINFKERRLDVAIILDELRYVGDDYALSLSEKLKIITTILNNIESANSELRGMLGHMYNSNHNDSVRMRLARNVEIKERYLSDISEKFQSFVFYEIKGFGDKEMDGDQFRKSYEEQRKILEEFKFKHASIPEILQEMDYAFGKMLLAKNIIFNFAFHEHLSPDAEDGYVCQTFFDYAAYSQLTPEIAFVSGVSKDSEREYEVANSLLRFLYNQEREGKIDPLQKKMNGELIKVVFDNNVESISPLVRSGADIHAGKDALVAWAAVRGEIEVVERLLDNGASVEVAKSHGSDTIKDLCIAHELRKLLDTKLQQSSPTKTNTAKLKI
ncbi:ankyrin repeat protein [Bordetella hinzii 5132]|uniref:hypothetical protein n=1 Tax=Bordetella hinzii TaxID=103855 RepID=UPI00045AB02E|nr:hypothetical protein [Bordetella hinzii]KCB41340.1 ankyrin repeat protein [Bordetella hinzii 5132]